MMHGTRSGYVDHDCRCLDCADADRRYHKARYERNRPRPNTDPSARLASQTWRAHAACAGTDPDLFYPVRPGGRGGGPARVAHEHAISICRRCPVAYQCLWYALDDLPGWLNELEQEVDNAYAELGFLFVRRRGTSDRGRDYVIMSAHQATAMLARLEGWDL